MKKKIDTKNSVIYKSDITNDLEKAITYIECNGYFSNTEDFSEYRYGELIEVRASYKRDCAFCACGLNFETYFQYFAPESGIVFEKTEEEKKLRPYKDIEEFFDETGLDYGKTIRYRKKDDTDRECVVIINGYINDGRILLGAVYYQLDYLVKYYEYYDPYNLIWKPFGVEE